MTKKNFKWWIALPTVVTVIPLIAAACDKNNNKMIDDGKISSPDSGSQDINKIPDNMPKGNDQNDGNKNMQNDPKKPDGMNENNNGQSNGNEKMENDPKKPDVMGDNKNMQNDSIKPDGMNENNNGQSNGNEKMENDPNKPDVMGDNNGENNETLTPPNKNGMKDQGKNDESMNEPDENQIKEYEKESLYLNLFFLDYYLLSGEQLKKVLINDYFDEIGTIIKKLIQLDNDSNILFDFGLKFNMELREIVDKLNNEISDSETNRLVSITNENGKYKKFLAHIKMKNSMFLEKFQKHGGQEYIKAFTEYWKKLKYFSKKIENSYLLLFYPEYLIANYLLTEKDNKFKDYAREISNIFGKLTNKKTELTDNEIKNIDSFLDKIKR